MWNGFCVIAFVSAIQPGIRELIEVSVIIKMKGLLFLYFFLPKQDLGDFKWK